MTPRWSPVRTLRTGPLSFRWRSCRWPVHCRPQLGRRNTLPRLRSPGQPRPGARHTSAARGAGTDGGQQTQRGRHGRLVLTSVDPRIGYRGCRRLRSGAGRILSPRRTRRRLISALEAVGHRGARRYVGHQSDRRDRERGGREHHQAPPAASRIWRRSPGHQRFAGHGISMSPPVSTPWASFPQHAKAGGLIFPDPQSPRSGFRQVAGLLMKPPDRFRGFRPTAGGTARSGQPPRSPLAVRSATAGGRSGRPTTRRPAIRPRSARPRAS